MVLLILNNAINIKTLTSFLFSFPILRYFLNICLNRKNEHLPIAGKIQNPYVCECPPKFARNNCYYFPPTLVTKITKTRSIPTQNSNNREKSHRFMAVTTIIGRWRWTRLGRHLQNLRTINVWVNQWIGWLADWLCTNVLVMVMLILLLLHHLPLLPPPSSSLSQSGVY